MSFVSSNFLPFGVDLNLGNNKSVVGINQENMGNYLIQESSVLPKTALLIL
jgi:hypothetical protein